MAEGLETQLYLTRPARFFEAVGLPDEDAWQRRPAMLPQFNLVVEDKYVEQFRDALGTVQVGGEPLQFKQSGSGFCGQLAGLVKQVRGATGQQRRRSRPIEHGGQPVAPSVQHIVPGFDQPDGFVGLAQGADQ